MPHNRDIPNTQGLEPVEPDFLPSGPCRFAPPTVKPDTASWSLQACGTAFTAKRIRPPEEMPIVPQEGFRPGAAESVTLAPIRAFGDTDDLAGDPNPEVCTHHHAHGTVLGNGYARQVMCIRPDANSGATHRNAFGVSFVATASQIQSLAERSDVTGFFREGYRYHVVGIPLPPWTELYHHSRGRHRCGAIA